MKANKLFISLSFLFLFGISLIAQETAEVKHDGIVFPRLTTYPVSPDSGQVIFFKGNTRFEYWDGTAWNALGGGDVGNSDKIDDGIDNDTYVKTIENGLNDHVEIQVEGIPMVNVNKNNLLINRNSTITAFETFGLRTDINSPTYGGMYVETNGHAGGKPFYGFAVDGIAQSFLYHDGASDELRFYNGGDRLAILNTGAIRIKNEYSLPTLDGDANQVIIANGSGTTSFANLHVLSDQDSDTKITTIENGSNDYIDMSVEASTGRLQLWKNPNGELRLELTGVSNGTVVGNNAGDALTTGALNNSIFGVSAGSGTTTGDDNTFIGTFTGYNNTTGSQNTYVGRRAAYSNNGTENTIIGYRAATNGSSNYNTLVGSQVFENMDNNSTQNVAIGMQAGESADLTSYSVLLGYQAGQLLNDGYNVMIGYQAGQNQNNTNQVMKDNVIIGYQAGQENDGNRNVYIGKQAGTNNQGDGNIFIGNNAGSIPTAANNQLRIANQNTNVNAPLIFGEFDNQMVGINTTNAQATLQVDANSGDDGLRVRIAGTTKFMVHENGRVSIGSATNPSYALELPNNAAIGTGWARAFGWQTYSDGRVKSLVTDIRSGLDLVNRLRPVTYRHHSSKYENDQIKIDEGEYTQSLGFIAQELAAVIPEAATKPIDENTDLWSIDYDKLVPVLTKAIQEQSEIIMELKLALTSNKEQIEKMEARLSELNPAESQ